jgi:hypothetical protein
LREVLKITNLIIIACIIALIFEKWIWRAINRVPVGKKVEVVAKKKGKLGLKKLPTEGPAIVQQHLVSIIYRYRLIRVVCNSRGFLFYINGGYHDHVLKQIMGPKELS